MLGNRDGLFLVLIVLTSLSVLSIGVLAYDNPDEIHVTQTDFIGGPDYEHASDVSSETFEPFSTSDQTIDTYASVNYDKDKASSLSDAEDKTTVDVYITLYDDTGSEVKHELKEEKDTLYTTELDDHYRIGYDMEDFSYPELLDGYHVEITYQFFGYDSSTEDFSQYDEWNTNYYVEEEDESPTVTTNNPSNIGTESAQFHGTLDDMGTASSVDVYFEYYSGNTTTQSLSSTESFDDTVTDLQSDTAYSYRAVAEGDGTDYGDWVAFETDREPPSLDVHPPSHLTNDSANIRVEVTDMGDYDDFPLHYEFNEEGDEEEVVCEETISSTGEYSCDVTNDYGTLKEDTTYHYEPFAYAEDQDVYYSGGEISFITDPSALGLTDWSVEPSTVSSDEEVTISGDVYNTGDEVNNDEVRWEIDGTLESQSPTFDMDPAETKTFTYSGVPEDDWNITSDGTYDVLVYMVDNDDTFESSFTVDNAPAYFDVSIDNTNSPINENQTLEVDYEVTNTGDEEGTQDIELHFDSEGNVVDSVSRTVSAGSTTTGTLSYDTSEDTGDYDIWVKSDDDQATDTIEIEDEPLDVDLSLATDWDAFPTEVGLDEEMVFDGYVDNDGTDTATNVQVRIDINDSFWTNSDYYDIEGGESKELNASLVPSEVGLSPGTYDPFTVYLDWEEETTVDERDGYEELTIRDINEPSVVTHPAENVTVGNATLVGEVTDFGGDVSEVDCRFNFRESGSETWGLRPSDDWITLTSPGNFTYKDTDLSQNTTYEYRSVCYHNYSDSVYGDTESFTTEYTNADLVLEGDWDFNPKNILETENVTFNGSITNEGTYDVPSARAEVFFEGGDYLIDWDRDSDGIKANETKYFEVTFEPYEEDVDPGTYDNIQVTASGEIENGEFYTFDTYSFSDDLSIEDITFDFELSNWTISPKEYVPQNSYLEFDGYVKNTGDGKADVQVSPFFNDTEEPHLVVLEDVEPNETVHINEDFKMIEDKFDVGEVYNVDVKAKEPYTSNIYDNVSVGTVEITSEMFIDILSPDDLSTYEVIDFPITFETSLSGALNYTTVCEAYGERYPSLEYCEVNATWDKDWVTRWIIPDMFTDWEEIDCLADDDYSEYDISEGDEIPGVYCDAEYGEEPFNTLILRLRHKETDEVLTLEKDNVDVDNKYTYEFTVDDFKESWDENTSFAWGEWEYDFLLHNFVDGNEWYSETRTLEIKEPPISDDAMRLIAKHDKTFREAWGDFEEPVSAKARAIFGLFGMLIIAIIGAYYAGSTVGFGVAILLGVMMDLLGWMPKLFSIFLIIVTAAFVLRIVWKIISPLPR